MNQVVSMIVFVVILNLSAGLLIELMPEVFADQKNNPFPNAKEYTRDFNNSLTGVVTPEALLEDQSSAFDRFLDMVSLGFYKRAQAFIDQYMFGVITMLQNIFGAGFHPALANLLRLVIVIGYTFTIIWIFTNKKFNG